MTKYVLIPDSFEGNLTYYYDSKGYLVRFEMNGFDMQQKTHEGILQSIGYMLTDALLMDFGKKHGYKIRRDVVDLSFETWWLLYGVARNKIQAERLWKQLSEANKWVARVNSESYNNWCLRNPRYTKMYPDTFLRSHYKDNWDKVGDWTAGKAKERELRR